MIKKKVITEVVVDAELCLWWLKNGKCGWYSKRVERDIECVTVGYCRVYEKRID